ncbi:divalent-cation tolerance protein CutA [Candidatus Daviesbacteria bacterium]|nr:divalent-cation tolerance protein CutA [Candidatus Daviesbacteria bacterium]
MKYILVITTTPTKKDAQNITQVILDKKLAACIQFLGPISSSYFWQGKIKITKEWLCLIKTKQSLYTRLESAIHAKHPYKIPEVLALPIIKGSDKYLSWLNGELK